MCMAEDLPGWNCIGQSFSHFAAGSRSSCSLCVSLSSLIVLESMLSSANSLKVLCLIYSWKSFMNTKKRIGPSTVPCGKPVVTCIFFRLFTVQYYCLCSECKEVFYPVQGIGVCAIVFQFVK